MRSADAIESLRSIPLFEKVGDADIERLADYLIERRYPQNSMIVEEGLPGDYMYVLQEGRVKVTKLSEDGREKILEILEPRSFFGEMSLLDRSPRSASVRTLDPVLALALSRTDFLGLLRNSSDLAMAVIQVLTHRLRDAGEHASSLSFQSVKDRAKGLFRRMAKEEASDGSQRMTPVLTHQQIADMISTSRETVTRVIKDLKDEGWLTQDGKRYVIPDEDF